jgi:hypothetical protein
MPSSWVVFRCEALLFQSVTEPDQDACSDRDALGQLQNLGEISLAPYGGPLRSEEHNFLRREHFLQCSLSINPYMLTKKRHCCIYIGCRQFGGVRQILKDRVAYLDITIPAEHTVDSLTKRRAALLVVEAIVFQRICKSYRIGLVGMLVQSSPSPLSS